MTKRLRRTTTNAAADQCPIIKTLGEIFSDGSIIDVVESDVENRVNLLFWNGYQETVAPEVHHYGHIYKPSELPETTLQRAILLPKRAANYGTAKALFSETVKLFESYIGFGRSEAALMTAWTCSTWFADCLSNPPLLVIFGMDMNHAITFFRLLRCLCRRPVILGDINHAALHSLAYFQATLLINRPNLSRRIRELWDTSNYRGVYVFGRGNRLVDVVGSKAIFLGMTNEFGDQALEVVLPPAGRNLPPLGVREQTEITGRFQPHFLMYRLRNVGRVREFCFADHQPELPDNLIAHNLLASIPEENDLIHEIGLLLRHQQEDVAARRSWDLNAAMVEVILALLHQGSKRTSPKEIAKLTNALLRSRGEILEYSAVEIGWKLRQLGLNLKRGAHNMVLDFHREVSSRIHVLAKRIGIRPTTAEGCPDCQAQLNTME